MSISISVAAGEFSPVIIFVAVGVLIVALVILGAMQAAKRRQAWQTLAQRLNCTYSSSDSFAIPDSYPRHLFTLGHSQKAYNVLSGRIKDREVLCFDYQYKETHGTGKNRHTSTYSFTCLLLDSPIPFVPLSIRPESFMDRVGEAFGLDDIDFESDEFSRRFFVKCGDKKFAYDIIHARAMELLLECGKIHVEAADRSCLFYYSGQISVPEEAALLIQHGLRFMELIPHYLIEQTQGART